MKYLFASNNPGSHAARLTTLKNVEDDYELLKGVPRLKGFPKDASFQMNDKFPEDIRLEDVLANRNGVLVVSEKFVSSVGDKGKVNIEILPVAILNHKGRKVSEPYYIFHHVKLQDCLDLKKADVVRNDIDPDLLISVGKLVIKPDVVDPKTQSFRMAHYPFVSIFREDLAVRLREAKITGLQFLDLNEWEG